MYVGARLRSMYPALNILYMCLSGVSILPAREPSSRTGRAKKKQKNWLPAKLLGLTTVSARGGKAVFRAKTRNLADLSMHCLATRCATFEPGQSGLSLPRLLG